MLLESAAIAANKVSVDEKITACIKQICLQGVVCKVSNRKTLSCETFCFLENICHQYLNVVLRATYCFFLRAAD